MVSSAGARTQQRCGVTLTLRCVTAAWCLLYMMTSRATMAVAQGSASASTGTCSYTIWTPTHPPAEVPPTVYPPGAVAYQRQTHKAPPENFFISNWCVGVILILCAVCGFYILLAARILYHLDLYAQHQAQKVVAASYVTKGNFHFDGKDAHGKQLRASGLNEQRVSGSRGGSPSFVPSLSHSTGSSSYEDSSDSGSPTDDDDNIIQINPLQR
ncbi:hypothetical protein LSCM1_07197 [Leishmania martiniquensis]|uniref:Uncharacterized protein n=1 Tax=Leishmania martiniquensis TaxID=1580590 RepID=A0A836HZM4_9TRYP|nr:hypothetical protein LSCM1_07197 [Leishmania martiniquensis]